MAACRSRFRQRTWYDWLLFIFPILDIWYLVWEGSLVSPIPQNKVWYSMFGALKVLNRCPPTKVHLQMSLFAKKQVSQKQAFKDTWWKFRTPTTKKTVFLVFPLPALFRFFVLPFSIFSQEWREKVERQKKAKELSDKRRAKGEIENHIKENQKRLHTKWLIL